MRVSAAGNMPLQGLVKPPAKPVVMILYRVKAYFKKQTRKGGFIMNNVDYKAMLYEKMNNEQNSYRKWLLSQQPAEILNHTYEYTTREDILMCMEELLSLIHISEPTRH